jgi:hypothetical protein
VRHWQPVLLAHTFSLPVGAIPPTPAPPRPAAPRRLPLRRRVGKDRGQSVHRATSQEAGGSSGRRRRGGRGVGSAPGRSCTALGDAGRAPAHRPRWPRSSPTSPAPFYVRRPLPLPDQPAVDQTDLREKWPTGSCLCARKPPKNSADHMNIDSYVQLSSRVGFVHHLRPLSRDELRFILEQKWREPKLAMALRACFGPVARTVLFTPRLM